MLVRRRENALKQERAKKLETLETLETMKFGDRLFAMVDHLTKTLPVDELYQMTPVEPEEFERLAHMRLYQLDLGLKHAPPNSVH